MVQDLPSMIVIKSTNGKFEGTLDLSEYLKRGGSTDKVIKCKKTNQLMTVAEAGRIAGVSVFAVHAAISHACMHALTADYPRTCFLQIDMNRHGMDSFTTWTQADGDIKIMTYMKRWKDLVDVKEEEDEKEEDRVSDRELVRKKYAKMMGHAHESGESVS
jgi:hypothetical protein